MRRGFLVVLIISLTLNAGFLGAATYGFLSGKAQPRGPEQPEVEMIPGEPAVKCGHVEECRPGEAVWVPQRVDCLSRCLCLEPGQRARLHESLASVEAEAIPAARSLCEERQALRRLLGRPDADAGEIRRRIRRISVLQSRMDSLAAEGMLMEMKELRPDQRAEYERAFCLARRGRH